MFEVEVENFQSIAKASFRVEGYTALVGRSNIGKSALIRAVKCALTGAVGTEFVRHGAKCERRARGTKKCACFSSVRIRLSPSLEVLWQKGDKVNRYEITRDGKTQEYEALERGDQEFLQPEFRRIVVGDSKDLIQVSDQFEPLFLVRDRGSVVADVLSDVAQLDDINGAIRLVSKDRKDAVATRTVRERDASDLRQNLAGYDGLSDVEARSAKLEAAYLRTEEQRDQVAKLEGYVARHDDLRAVLSRLQDAVTPAVPNWDPISRKVDALNQLTGFHRHLLVLKEVMTGLTAANKAKLSDWSSLPKYCATIEALHKFEAGIAERVPVVERLSDVGGVQVPEVGALPKKVDQLALLDGWLGRMRQIKSSFEGLQTIKALPEVSAEAVTQKAQRLKSLNELCSKYLRLLAAKEELERRVATALEEETKAVEELNEIGICPTCTQGLGSGQHLHLGGGA